MRYALGLLAMIDTLRLFIPADRFPVDAYERLRSLQTKVTKSSWDGETVLFTLIGAVALPSWYEGFFLQLGDRITLEASPKIYQGHNVTGVDDLLTAAGRLVDHVFGTVFGLSDYPRAPDWYLSRIDVTHQYDFGHPETLACWMDTCKGVSRGIRRASVDASAPEDTLTYDGYGPSMTLYVGKRSRYKAGKIYCKGSELKRHAPRAIRGVPGAVDALAAEFSAVARFESVTRALWISDHAVGLGLLPAHFKDLASGLLRENVSRWSTSSGVPVLVGKSKAEPILHFPLWFLSSRLDLSVIWRSEFDHLFALETAMDDSTLLQACVECAPTSAQGRAAYHFLRLVRAVGLVQARESVSKTSWYRFRSILRAAGVSDAQLQDGAPLVRVALDPVKVLEFRPSSERLRLVEAAHRAAMASDIARLRGVLKVA